MLNPDLHQPDHLLQPGRVDVGKLLKVLRLEVELVRPVLVRNLQPLELAALRFGSGKVFVLRKQHD